MPRDYVEFQERSVPLGFLITIRCYGTWLHGDERGSMNRRSHNTYGAAKLPANERLNNSDRSLLTSPTYELGAAERSTVEAAIREVCKHRGLGVAAINVRTNHAHAVVIASSRPEKLMNGLKSYATRRLREAGLAGPTDKIWSRHGSTRYLWTEGHIETAVQYVLYGQGDELPKLD